MAHFPGSDIEKRMYWKFELARLIGCSSCTLRRYCKAWESEFRAIFPDYKRTDKMLAPNLSELVLRKMGVIE
jgi:hypothetical protein